MWREIFRQELGSWGPCLVSSFPARTTYIQDSQLSWYFFQEPVMMQILMGTSGPFQNPVPRLDLKDYKISIFRSQQINCSLNRLSILQKRSRRLMKVLKSSAPISSRVELSGPDQPHLILVDPPGLFEAGSRDQSEADIETVPHASYQNWSKLKEAETKHDLAFLSPRESAGTMKPWKP